MKITEELRESWHREFRVQTALGTISQDPYYGDGVPYVYSVRYSMTYDGNSVPAWQTGNWNVTVNALHAHHAVSIVLARADLFNEHSTEFFEVLCEDVKWNKKFGWMDEY